MKEERLNEIGDEKMKGAILSLNHIIIDTDKLQFQAWRELAMYEFGMGLPGKLEKRLVDLSREEALDVILKHFNQTEADKDELLNEQFEMYTKVINGIDEKSILPNGERLLVNFYDHYVDLAVNDIDGHAKEILQKLKLDDYFDVYVDPSEGNPYFEASQQLNAQPFECVGIGTSKQEISSMNEAHVISIGVGNADNLSAADYQVSVVGDLRYPMIRKTWEDKVEQ